ncbi:pyridoxamine 5'-phosphate oxidase family protein [Jiangella mangrovi]|uniref:Nitroimidazol reductase NimA-like FMN-containing flavoprotein (Pyridoxamine 5'-phosphate oxidase superfamily) n=1 Tax=Jiangella mangrovi TaxID=1524084 RepID=A0A7W9LL58_9ACTN|nr:pyridoxamine 5'-phosphate oxidase family protein [Jiangella mangrovi]MBB5787811.1 nitroimidazol reductase NimA-like FMN-containing flavoprotein (pyridoxamine 5'-phosphate oxidase superfamily) [Jiangella mangrovi]
MATNQTSAPTRLTRMGDKAVTELAALHALLDDVLLGHVAVVVDGHPVAFPTAVARDGDRLLVHGSTGSSWLRTLATGTTASVTVTALDAVVVARASFESSFHYRSAVLFGRFAALAGDDKERALDVLVDRILPGRTGELRRPTKRELAATLICAMPIDEWSLKVSERWPDDLPEDVDGPAWAGIVPLRSGYGDPVPAPDLRDGIAVPPSVRALTD